MKASSIYSFGYADLSIPKVKEEKKPEQSRRFVLVSISFPLFDSRFFLSYLLLNAFFTFWLLRRAKAFKQTRQGGTSGEGKGT